MTTNIIVKTHDWPVKVILSDNYSNRYLGKAPVARSGWGRTVSIVPPHSEESFAVTDTRSIECHELAKDYDPATDYDFNDHASHLDAKAPAPATAEHLP